MMNILQSFLMERRKRFYLFLSFFGIILLVFFLYSVRLDAVVYACALCAAFGIAAESLAFFKYVRKYKALSYLEQKISYDRSGMPEVENELEERYQKIIKKLFDEKERLQSNSRIEKKEMEEYYMLWAHQIKTPIAAMNLLLQSKEADEKELSAELFKIEQYVEMVLGYLRAEQMGADLSLKQYELDDIVKQAIRKYSKLFILQKMKLDLSEISYQVLTDEKWLLFALEQILSNALKYTKEGQISIYMAEDRNDTLVVEDTGIGISPEDLPRVTEKGFTGYNGRSDKKSTGLGLYLTKEILEKLGHALELQSEVGEGTKVYIYLGRK